MSRVLTLILILSCLFVGTGCWGVRDITRLNYPVAIGMDPVPKKMEKKIPHYSYTFSLPVLSERAKKPRQIHTVQGLNIQTALSALQAQVGKQISVGHVRVIAFGEEVAKEGLDKHLDFFLRTPSIKLDTLMVISAGQSAEKLLNQPTLEEPGMGIYIYNLLDVVNNNVYIRPVSVNDYTIDREDAPAASIIPTITASGEKTYLSGVAILKKGKMVGKLNRNEAEALEMLRNTKARGVIPLGNGKAEFAALGTAKSKIIPSFQKGKFSFLIKVKFNGALREGVLGGDYSTNQKDLAPLAKKMANNEKKFLEKVIHKVQKEFKADVIGLGNAAYINCPKQFNPKEWEKEFPRVPIKVEVEINLVHAGTGT